MFVEEIVDSCMNLSLGRAANGSATESFLSVVGFFHERVIYAWCYDLLKHQDWLYRVNFRSFASRLSCWSYGACSKALGAGCFIHRTGLFSACNRVDSESIQICLFGDGYDYWGLFGVYGWLKYPTAVFNSACLSFAEGSLEVIDSFDEVSRF